MGSVGREGERGERRSVGRCDVGTRGDIILDSFRPELIQMWGESLKLDHEMTSDQIRMVASGVYTQQEVCVGTGLGVGWCVRNFFFFE